MKYNRWKLKSTICLIIAYICFVILLACSTISIILQIKNPDMTEMRLFLEYPWVSIISLIDLIILLISLKSYDSTTNNYIRHISNPNLNKNRNDKDGNDNGNKTN